MAPASQPPCFQLPPPVSAFQAHLVLPITVFHQTLPLFPGTIALSNDYHHLLASAIIFTTHVIDLSKPKNVKSGENASVPLLTVSDFFIWIKLNRDH